MAFEASLEYAKKLDEKDPLERYRKRFYFPKHKGKRAIYLCGNSLGLQPKTVSKAIKQELKDWKNLAVGGYFNGKHPWLTYHQQFKKPLADMMGCRPEEVTVMNALTVNLHLLLMSFYKPSGSRHKIIMEAGAFPSDQYAVETQVGLYDYNPDDAIIEIEPRGGEKTLRTEDIIQIIESNRESVCLVLLGGINYYTGQLYDIKQITQVAHDSGAIAGFDLAHVVGNVPMSLRKWNVDFAVWCSYKYLNGGPGAVAGIYIHQQYGNDLAYRRLGGWWGNDEKTRFKMEKGFMPKHGASGWQLSTTQVFNMVALKASMEIFDEVGIRAIRKKSIKQTAYLEYLLKQLVHLKFEIITPADPQQRGAQLSLYFSENGKAIHDRLIENGIIVDYREPGVIRVAPAPLYNSYEDVFKFYIILKEFNLV